MTVFLSLCLIVKNEEKVLRKCLDSVKDGVDEIIIVDTGSTDQTLSIAQEYTNLIYSFEWISDFSAARNESIKHATGKWILILDADEYFIDQEILHLRRFLLDKEPKENEAYIISQLSLTNNRGVQSVVEGTVGRIFPNHHGIVYHRPIHEQLTSTRGVELSYIPTGFKVYHTGHSEEAIHEKNKHERNMEIFENWKLSANFTPYDYHTLGNQLQLMGKSEEALEHYIKALTSEPRITYWYAANVAMIVQILMKGNRYTEAWNYIDRYLQKFMTYPDILCLRGIVQYNMGFIVLAKDDFLSAIRECEHRAQTNQPLSIVSPDLSLNKPVVQLIHIFEKQNDIDKAVYYLTKLVASNINENNAQKKLFELLSLNASPEVVTNFLLKLVDERTLGMIALLAGSSTIASQIFNQKVHWDSLSPPDQLKYALLMKDGELYQDIISNSKPEERHVESFLRLRTLGRLVGIDSERSFAELKSKTEDETFELLSELFTLHYLEEYHRLLDDYGTPSIIDRLANWFYRKHMNQEALQYYQYLLERELKLSLESCTNLADLHLNQNYEEEALVFLEHAISLAPDRQSLYIEYCRICKDDAPRQRMKERLIALDPHYSELPLFQRL